MQKKFNGQEKLDKRSWLHYGKKFRVFGGCLKDSMQSSSEMKEW